MHGLPYAMYFIVLFILLEEYYWFLFTIYLSDSYGLGELYEEWYAKQHLERDFVKVSKDRIESTSMTEKSLDYWTQHSLRAVFIPDN